MSKKPPLKKGVVTKMVETKHYLRVMGECIYDLKETDMKTIKKTKKKIEINLKKLLKMTKE